MTLVAFVAQGFAVGFGAVHIGARLARRRRQALEARVVPFECRACGRGPSHSNVGTWGGLIPIEDTYACGGVVRGSAGVFLCDGCYVEIGTEVMLFFQELSREPLALLRGIGDVSPRKTCPPRQPVTPHQHWLGGWL